MALHFAACVTRFRSPNGAVCGAGFLIDRRHVMTCAHVVNAALGRELVPGETLSLRFDLPFASATGIEAHLAEWHAPVAYEALKPDVPSDVAVLRLLAERPAGTIVAQFASGYPKWGDTFRTFGFPVEQGQPADGETLDADAGGWVHFRQTKDYGHLIKPGFSGAPVFAVDTNTIIGMIVAVQQGDGSRVAYGEPVRRLHMAWPPMAHPYKGLARFEPEDADLFFGRKEIVAKLLERLERDPVTLIVGASGGGKSSLVFGGVLPKLDPAQWRVAPFPPRSEPITKLAWAVAALMVPPGDPGRLLDQMEGLQQGLMKSPDKLFNAARAWHRQSYCW